MKKLLLLLLGLCGMLHAAEIVCEKGNFPGHLQGIAADTTGIYWSFTDTIVKTDYTGKALKTVTTPIHAGDLCTVQDKIYVTLLYRQKEMIKKDGGSGWIYVYSQNLDFIEKKPLPETPKPDGITFARGKFYIGDNGFWREKHPFNYICVYSEDFQLEKKIKVDLGVPTVFGAQTLNTVGDKILAGFYAKPGSWVLPLPDLKTPERFPAKLNVGMAVVPESLSGGKTLLLLAQSTGHYKTKNCGGKIRIMEWKDGKLIPAELQIKRLKA